MILGIVDVGTNSIHLLIGLLGLNGRFHVIVKERDLTRLGEGGLARNALTGSSMRRAFEVLRDYARILKRCGVDHVEAVATSAVRDAANGRAFVSRVRRQLGLPLRIISGREEARLIYLGVVRAHEFRHPTLIVTIGGGSAQVIHGDGTQLRYAESVPLGGARLAQRFIRHDPPKQRELDALRDYATRVWARVGKAVKRHAWRQAVGSSATIFQLMLAAHLRRDGREPAKKRSLTVSRAALQELLGWLAASKASDRIRMPGLDPRREDLALPTGVALLTWMEACGVARLRYAAGSLREGLVIDYLIRHHRRWARTVLEDPLIDRLVAPAGLMHLGANGVRLSLHTKPEASKRR